MKDRLGWKNCFGNYLPPNPASPGSSPLSFASAIFNPVRDWASAQPCALVGRGVAPSGMACSRRCAFRCCHSDWHSALHCGSAGKRHQRSGFVVIDEVAGQMIALIAVPVDWKYMMASFILFRSFDIVKPFPLRRLETLPRGTGIMMDDVGAGLYALVLLQLWLHFIAR